jgi:transcriptional regulator GlxA family with amidase domain
VQQSTAVMRIEIPVFDGFDELDAVGPYEVLRTASQLSADAGWEVALVGAHGPGEVVAAHGLRLSVAEGLGRPDAVIVPGGGWTSRTPRGTWQEVQAGVLPARLAEVARSCRWVASVCTGAMLLAAAGLTRGRRVTTHHDALDELRATGAQLVDGARVVDDGDLLTAAGVTAGLDLALWIVERMYGSAVAEAVASEIEHPRVRDVHRALGEDRPQPSTRR